jgi:hypothetical protein
VLTWLSGQLPYREVCAVLERVGQIKVSASTVWREVQVRGEALGVAEAPQGYDSKQVVDWYHGTQHLAVAAHNLHADESEAQRFYEKWKTKLYQGQAAQIADHLTQAAAPMMASQPSNAAELQTEAGYFETHQRRMQYMQMREEGWPIGSGMVESGCKQFKQRFAGPGMRWSRIGAEHLIPIRAAVMSQPFDSVWKRAFNSPKN